MEKKGRYDALLLSCRRTSEDEVPAKAKRNLQWQKWQW